MSKFKEKSEYMAMRVSGFLGWLHRIVMLITFPIRKFWMIVTVLVLISAILIAIPMFYGIPLRDVWDWYMVKMPNHEFVEAKDKTLFGAKEQVDKLRRTFKDIVPNRQSDTASKDKKERPKTKLVAWHVAEFRKVKYKPRPATPIIKKAEENKGKAIKSVNIKSIPVVSEEKPIKAAPIAKEAFNEEPIDNVTILENNFTPAEEPPAEEVIVDYMQEAAKSAAEPIATVETVEYEEPTPDYLENINDYYIRINNSDLSYLPEPLIYEGKIKVIGPNSVYVNGKFLFLYGVYSNPRRYNVKAATDYLRDITLDREAYCVAVARSKKTRALAALCFMEGVLINKALVELNLAQNVALK